MEAKAMKATLVGTIVQVKLSDDGKFCDLGLQQEGSLNGVRLWGFTDSFGGVEPVVGTLVSIEAFIMIKTSKRGEKYQSVQYKSVTPISAADAKKLKVA